MRHLSVALLLALTCGCTTSSLQPVSEDTTIRGVRAKGLMMELHEPLRWYWASPPHRSSRCALPKGKYVAEGEDGTFVYFRAPKDVVYTERIGMFSNSSRSAGKGGMYVRSGSGSLWRSDIGAYLWKDACVKRVMTGYETDFFDLQGKMWRFIEQKDSRGAPQPAKQ